MPTVRRPPTPSCGLGKYFQRGEISADQRTLHKVGGRAADDFYRDRWAHDKVVRSTHGVNCTGSCSWKIYVKDGVITWESQQTDYPSVGADKPEYEPRGCPRGASFSWYTYSPARVRYPYVRGVLLEYYREAKERLKDPVLAWADIVEDPAKAKRYKAARGKGGFVRAEWWEAAEIAAAAHVHTIKKYGPDRVAGFSPIPAMSMVSHAAGARFVSLLGGSMLSFYDWYADLPVASPQVFGDQTDVPESADWFDAGYLIMWGSNVPVTRTPDAHYMTEARYRGQKVVVVSPDYADNTKFADEWLPARPGTDAALAMSMGHVILKEFFVDRQTPYFTDYVKRYTDLPYLVTLTETEARAGKVPHRRGSRRHRRRRERPRPCCSTPTATPWCPTARWDIGSPIRRGASGTSTCRGSTRCSRCTAGRPASHRRAAAVRHRSSRRAAPRCADEDRCRSAGYDGVRPVARPVRRGPRRPARRAGRRATTTPTQPYTPAWQEPITGVPADGGRADRARVRRQRRTFAAAAR